MELVRKTKLDAKCGGFNNFLSQKMKQNRNTRIVGTANDGSATSAVAKKLLAGLWCVAAVALLMG